MRTRWKRPVDGVSGFPRLRAVDAGTSGATPAAAAFGATQTLNALGITTVQDAFASAQILRTWTALDREQGLSVRHIASLSGLPPTQEGDLSGLPLVDARETYRSAHVRPDFAKLFLDGVPPARTASMVEPHLPHAKHGADGRGSGSGAALLPSPIRMSSPRWDDCEWLLVACHCVCKRPRSSARKTCSTHERAPGSRQI